MAALQRTLGLPALVFLGVGVIVGAGIYSVIGAAAGAAGGLLWASFALAAVPAGLAALHYAELVAMFPKIGGEYVFLREAFPRHRWVSTGTGLVVALANAATAATVALAFAGYLERFAPIPTGVAAAALIAVCTAVNVAGIRESTGLAVVFTLVELAGLALVVGLGMASGRFAERAFEPGDTGVLHGAALIFFVYTGFEGIVNLAEEAKRPRRDLPRALLLSGGITTAVYLLVALAATSLAEPRALADSASPLATATESVPWVAVTLAAIALFSTGNTALITLVVSSRILLAMAREGDLPRAFGAVLPGRRTPLAASLAMLVAAGALLPIGKIAVVGSVSSLLTLLSFAAVAAAVIALRRAAPQRERPFRVPFAIRGVPLPAVLTIAAAIALAAQFELAVFAIAGAALLVAFGAGRLRTRKARRR
jgi:APA family basic amino acid/polyamine antiporter